LLLSQYLKLESILSFFLFRILFLNLNSIFVFLVCRSLCGFLFVYISMTVCSVQLVLLVRRAIPNHPRSYPKWYNRHIASVLFFLVVLYQSFFTLQYLFVAFILLFQLMYSFSLLN